MDGVTLNRSAEALFSGKFLNASTVGSVLAEVLKETIGPSSIETEHFHKGQSKWASLSKKWLADKRKRGASGKFYLTGRVLRAISRAPASGKLRDFGSSADIYSTARSSQKRYAAGGVYANVKIGRTTASLTVGFNGTFKHSRAFNIARKQEAIEQRGKAGKISALEVRRRASISRTETRLRRGLSGKGPLRVRKFEAKGSLGLASGLESLTSAGTALARDVDNLAYANLLQRGVHKGIRTKSGTVLSPQHVGNLRLAGQKVEGEAVSGKAMPLLPFETEDMARLEKAFDRGVGKICEALQAA